MVWKKTLGEDNAKKMLRVSGIYFFCMFLEKKQLSWSIKTELALQMKINKKIMCFTHYFSFKQCLITHLCLIPYVFFLILFTIFVYLLIRFLFKLLIIMSDTLSCPTPLINSCEWIKEYIIMSVHWDLL